MDIYDENRYTPLSLTLTFLPYPILTHIEATLSAFLCIFISEILKHVRVFACSKSSSAK